VVKSEGTPKGLNTGRYGKKKNRRNLSKRKKTLSLPGLIGGEGATRKRKKDRAQEENLKEKDITCRAKATQNTSGPLWKWGGETGRTGGKRFRGRRTGP